MRSPYSAYAGVYDRSGQTRFGEAMARLTIEWLASQDFRPGTALDLATGTGAAALAFARVGIDATGLDRSPEMLAQAAEKARSEHLPINLIEGDMRAFDIDTPAALVTAFFDSVNYLISDQDLAACFQSVARALIPGGWFVFDMNTLDRYRQVWNDSTEIAFQDDATLVIYRSSFDPATGVSPLLLTAFERIDPERDLWRRWDETHIERGYPLAEIERMLAEAGLDPVSVEALNERTMSLEGPATERSARAVFFAQKPASPE